jgi:menaquinone-dependent protoporphyrinogen oxidase
MRVLVAYGSKRGGTEGIAKIIGGALRSVGLQADVMPASEVRELSLYDAVMVGGALYANRWHRDARDLVRRHERELLGRPVWLFSSGPLDDSADRRALPPVSQVRRLLTHINARGHETFGGRLEKNARGLIAGAMAKKLAGDWRNPARIHRWAIGVAQQLRPMMPPQGKQPSKPKPPPAP